MNYDFAVVNYDFGLANDKVLQGSGADSDTPLNRAMQLFVKVL